MLKFRKKGAKPPPQPKKTVNRADLTIPEHLNELRQRLLRGLVAMIIAILICFAFGERLIEILAYPIGGVERLISIEVTENVSVFMRVSLLGGFILAFPYLLYEALAYIRPALEDHEWHGLLVAIPFATILFISGVLFAYFVMLPAALPFLISFIGITTTPRLSNYFSFVTGLLFWIGVSFETPLVVYLLARFRLVTAGALAKQWRVAVVVIAVLAAFVTPTPDPVNMGLLMIPLLVLYVLSIGMAKIANPAREEK